MLTEQRLHMHDNVTFVTLAPRITPIINRILEFIEAGDPIILTWGRTETSPARAATR
jgi:hypothetical protein